MNHQIGPVGPEPGVDPTQFNQQPVVDERNWFIRHPRFSILTAGTIIASSLVVAGNSVDDGSSDRPGLGNRDAELAEKDKSLCAETWTMSELDHGDNNRWKKDGLQAIYDAKNDDEAKQASFTWLNTIKRDKEVLAGAAMFVLGRQVDSASLKNGECSSEEAEALVAELEMELALAAIKRGEVPATAVNSGVDANGNVVQADEPGISGDRTGLHVVLINGEQFWILGRCIQICMPGHIPTIPKGPTDEDKKDRPTSTFVTSTTVQPGTTTTTTGRSTTSTTIGRTTTTRPGGGGTTTTTTGGTTTSTVFHHTPAQGPPPVANQPAHPAPATPSYETGNAEEVVGQQDSETAGGLDTTTHGTEAGEPGSSPGGGEESVITQPGPNAPSNPVFESGTASPGTNEGTSNEAGSNDAQTEGTGQTSGAGSDPGMP